MGVDSRIVQQTWKGWLFVYAHSQDHDGHLLDGKRTIAKPLLKRPNYLNNHKEHITKKSEDIAKSKAGLGDERPLPERPW